MKGGFRILNLQLLSTVKQQNQQNEEILRAGIIFLRKSVEAVYPFPPGSPTREKEWSTHVDGRPASDALATQAMVIMVCRASIPIWQPAFTFRYTSFSLGHNTNKTNRPHHEYPPAPIGRPMRCAPT